LCHTTQHGAVLIIFPLNLQTITITRMWSSGGEVETFFKGSAILRGKRPFCVFSHPSPLGGLGAT